MQPQDNGAFQCSGEGGGLSGNDYPNRMVPLGLQPIRPSLVLNGHTQRLHAIQLKNNTFRPQILALPHLHMYCKKKTYICVYILYVFLNIEGERARLFVHIQMQSSFFCVTVHLCVLKCSGNRVLCWQLHSSGERISIPPSAKRRHFDVALCVLYLLSGNLASLSCLLPLLPALP